MQAAADPDAALGAFSSVSTTRQAADLGAWDRDLLECAQGAPRRVRSPDAASAGAAATAAGEGAVEREDGPAKGRYRLVVDGVEAEMTYSRAGDGLIIIDHTEVPTALRVVA